MWNVIKPLLFSLPPETAHAVALRLVRTIGWSKVARSLVKKIYRTQEKPVEVWGIKFKNRVGLAAGWDKDGVAMHGLSALGFGHIEVGTVTPEPQSGREKPRIFRLPQDESLINRMGFPSKGDDHLALRMMKRPHDTVVGVNIGKNSFTKNEEAFFDYCWLLQRFAPRADYIVMNISSPNTEGLRDLQSRNSLEDLLERVRDTRIGLPDWQQNVPLLVKLSPDLSDVQLEEAIGISLDKGIDGFVATNTTISREGLSSHRKFEAGGTSGKILTQKSRDVLKKIVHQVDGKVPIISSGGIMSPEEGKIRIDMGASLVQVYTGLVYHGPKLVKQLVETL